jgi:hypothetical protein
LTRALFELLLILVQKKQNAPATKDVAWQSLDGVAEALGRVLGRPASKRAVVGLIHRLRKTLTESGCDARIVETNRKQGVRVYLGVNDKT